MNLIVIKVLHVQPENQGAAAAAVKVTDSQPADSCSVILTTPNHL